MDEAGCPIDVRDPMAGRLRDALDPAGPPAGRVAAVLGMAAVFGDDLPRVEPFVAAVTQAYQALLDGGARSAAARILAR